MNNSTDWIVNQGWFRHHESAERWLNELVKCALTDTHQSIVDCEVSCLVGWGKLYLNMHNNKESYRPSAINFATKMVDLWNRDKAFRNFVLKTIACNLSDKEKSLELTKMLARKFIFIRM